MIASFTSVELNTETDQQGNRHHLGRYQQQNEHSLVAPSPSLSLRWPSAERLLPLRDHSCWRKVYRNNYLMCPSERASFLIICDHFCLAKGWSHQRGNTVHHQPWMFNKTIGYTGVFLFLFNSSYNMVCFYLYITDKIDDENTISYSTRSKIKTCWSKWTIMTIALGVHTKLPTLYWPNNFVSDTFNALIFTRFWSVTLTTSFQVECGPLRYLVRSFPPVPRWIDSRKTVLFIF